jgi:acyl-CoA synthetase (AMP-forming)/AMP-acid ligase II
MGLLQAALSCNAENEIAVDDGHAQLSYGQLREAVNEARRSLAAVPVRRVALLASNSAGWVVADLALHFERLPSVPLPVFFTDAQLRHAIDDAGIETLLTDDPQRTADCCLAGWTPERYDPRVRCPVANGCDSERPPLRQGPSR